jgi:hypothetical protein
METTLTALLHRLRLANFEKNKNQKYRAYARGDDFFKKIGNKSDEMMRVAFFLTNFLISTPPRYKDIPDLANAEEKLDDYDNPSNDVDHLETWDYHCDGYTLYELENLPILQEAELDSNLVMFHAFLSFIKPTNFFIDKYEMYLPQSKESKKQNVTRVLMNLSQLLLFARCMKGKENVHDISTVIFCLFYRFSHYFSICETDDISLRNANIFEMFPSEAAYFLMFLIAYDDYQNTTFDQFREELPHLINPKMFSSSSTEAFQRALEGHLPTLNSIIDNSSNMTDLINKLQSIFDADFLRLRVLQMAKVLTMKALLVINDLAEWDLKTDYLDINYEEIFNVLKVNHAKFISELRTKMEEEISERDESNRTELHSKLKLSEESNAKFKEQNAIQSKELMILRNENVRLKEEISEVQNKSCEDTTLTFRDVEKKYPDLIKNIKNTTYRLALQKANTRINDLEEELTTLRKRQRPGEPTTKTFPEEQPVAIRGPDHVEEPQDFYGDRSAYSNSGSELYGHSIIGYGDRTSYGDHSSYNNNHPYRRSPRGYPLQQRRFNGY